MTTARQVLDAAESEADFQANVIKIAEANGWAVWHDNDPRRNTAGLPDLILIRGAVLLWLELKTEKGKESGAQKAFIKRLQQVKYVSADVVRPHDMDRIVQVLTSKRR